MGLKIYVSGMSGNKEVKKRQQRVLMILDSKSIKYDVIDITEPGKETDKEFMQTKSSSNGATVSDPEPRHSLPPQIFNDEEYCGDYDAFDLANEIDTLEQFLKLAPAVTSAEIQLQQQQQPAENTTTNGEDKENRVDNEKSNVSIGDAQDHTAASEEQKTNSDEQQLETTNENASGDKPRVSDLAETDEKVDNETAEKSCGKEIVTISSGDENESNDDLSEQASNEKEPETTGKEQAEKEEEAKETEVQTTENAMELTETEEESTEKEQVEKEVEQESTEKEQVEKEAEEESNGKEEEAKETEVKTTEKALELTETEEESTKKEQVAKEVEQESTEKEQESTEKEQKPTEKEEEPVELSDKKAEVQEDATAEEKAKAGRQIDDGENVKVKDEESTKDASSAEESPIHVQTDRRDDEEEK